MLTLHDLKIQAIIYNELVWPSGSGHDLPTFSYRGTRGGGGGGPLYGLYEYVPWDRLDRFWSSWSLQRVSFSPLFALCSQCDP